MHKKAFSFISCMICFLLYLQPANAGGWPVGKGRLVWVPGATLYYSNKYWDENGTLRKLNGGDKYVAYYFSHYLDYGLSRKLDLVANIPLVSQKSVNSGVAMTNTGLGDITAGLSYNFADIGTGTHLSVQASGIIPAYEKTKEPATGFGTFGAEGKLTLAGSTGKKLLYSYYVIDAGYRYFFQEAGPGQFSYNVTIGTPLDKYNQVGIDVGGVTSSSTIKGFTNNINIGRDFSFFKVAAKYGRRISRSVSVYVSAYATPTGRNTGKGYGGNTFLVCKF